MSDVNVLVGCLSLRLGLPIYNDSNMSREEFLQNVQNFAYTPGKSGTDIQKAFSWYENFAGSTKQPHEYSDLTQACWTTSMDTCGNPAQQFNLLRQYAGPGTDGSKLASNGVVNYLSLGPLSLGYVTHLIDPGTSSLVNITLPGQHALDPGFVVRQIIPDGRGGFSIDTRGWGTGSSPMFDSNVWAAGSVWGGNSAFIGFKADGFKWPWGGAPTQPRCVQTAGLDGKQMQVCQ